MLSLPKASTWDFFSILPGGHWCSLPRAAVWKCLISTRTSLANDWRWQGYEYPASWCQSQQLGDLNYTTGPLWDKPEHVPCSGSPSLFCFSTPLSLSLGNSSLANHLYTNRPRVCFWGKWPKTHCNTPAINNANLKYLFSYFFSCF